MTNDKNCANCIWSDQCDEDQPCEHYDDGLSEETLSSIIYENRVNFREEYFEFLEELEGVEE